MKIEVLIAIKSKGKKDISAILSSMNIDSDARIAVYHYNGAKEEKLDYKGHTVCVHYIAAGTKMAAYNELLRLTDADVILFADPVQRFVSDYIEQIESAFVSYPKCDGILFGTQKEGKRVGVKEARKHSFSALCMKTNVLRERGLAFIDVGDGTYNEGAMDVFRHEFIAWPSRCIKKVETILFIDEPLENDAPNLAFYDSHRFGILWLVVLIIRFFGLRKQKRGDFKAFLKAVGAGHHAYFFKDYEKENKPIKENSLPFATSLISMLGFAVQLTLSLLIVFTEVQYIPIWVSLIFLILFAMIYAFSSPKVHNVKSVLLIGSSIGLVSFIGAFVIFVSLGVFWAMATYGSCICLIAVLGLMYCFLPSRRHEIKY